MSKIYLPNYISAAESVRSLMLSQLDTHLIIIKIRNYNILETLVNPSILNDMLLSIEGKICAFCVQNGILEYNVALVQNYIFVTAKNAIPNVANKLKKELYNVEFLAYISFGVVSDYGKISDVLPRLIQSLAYTDNALSISPDIDCSNVIAHEYRALSLLKKALSHDTAGFAYQPIVDSKNGHVVYHECLMRIPDENGQWISAGPAIILAEKYGIIDMVDEAVISMAATELKSFEDIEISVNISNIGLLNEVLLEKIVKLFKKNDAAKRLIVEVTETSANEDIAKTIHFIDTIRDLGIRVALDDFGVGVTSFKQLCAIKFDIIKIDGSFIKDVATNPYHRFITEMVVKLARDTGAKTVAEFVENGEIAKILMDLDVDFMQGHFFFTSSKFSKLE